MNASKADEYLTVAEIASELKLATDDPELDRSRITSCGARRAPARPRPAVGSRSNASRRRHRATAPAAAEQTPTDPVQEIRQRLDPALQSARDALASDRKSDLAGALSALLETAEEAIATLEQSASSPPPDPPGRQPLEAAGPTL